MEQQHFLPPVAQKKPHPITFHGDTRIDDYFWLRDRNNPDVIDHLLQENSYTERVMKHTEALQRRLFKEMLSRIKETDESVPEKDGEYYYYHRMEEGKQYPIYCRKKGSLHSPEEVVLDQNELASGHVFCSIGSFDISTNHQYLVYGVDFDGDEVYTLYVKDLFSGLLLSEKIENVAPNAVWANDNTTFFYVRLDETKRPYRLYRQRLGESNDVLVYEEKEANFFLAVEKTRSEKYIIMTLGSKVTSEEWIIPADHPDSAPRLFFPRMQDIEYFIDHRGDEFFVYTNDGAKNFRVMKTNVGNTAKSQWQEVIPHRFYVKLAGIDVFLNYLVVYERENGLKNIHVYDLREGSNHRMEIDEPVYTIATGGNLEFDTEVLRVVYASLVTPNTVYDYNMRTKERVLLKEQIVIGGYEKNDYASEQIFANAPDGTLVPISLVYKKTTKLDGTAPLFLYGYGSYGISIDP